MQLRQMQQDGRQCGFLRFFPERIGGRTPDLFGIEDHRGDFVRVFRILFAIGQEVPTVGSFRLLQVNPIDVAKEVRYLVVKLSLGIEDDDETCFRPCVMPQMRETY